VFTFDFGFQLCSFKIGMQHQKLTGFVAITTTVLGFKVECVVDEHFPGDFAMWLFVSWFDNAPIRLHNTLCYYISFPLMDGFEIIGMGMCCYGLMLMTHHYNGVPHLSETVGEWHGDDLTTILTSFTV